MSQRETADSASSGVTKGRSSRPGEVGRIVTNRLRAMVTTFCVVAAGTDHFGGSAAVAGEIMFVGSPYDLDDEGVCCGSVYILDLSSSPADLDCNDDVDEEDLALLLEAWGACPDPPPGCAADLNGDEVADVLDLLMLIAAWGPCP